MFRVIALVILTITIQEASSVDFDQWISEVKVINDCEIEATQTKSWTADIEGYNSPNYEKSISEWMPSAKSGDPQMQFYIAKAYFNGDGVEVDLEKSLHWYKQSSSQEYPVAQNNLALLYENGVVVNKDTQKSFSIMCKSAHAGLNVSQHNIGRYYQFGIGVDRDGEKAKKWYKKAIKHNHAGSAYSLATMYLAGDILKQNTLQAIQLIEHDAEKQYPPAMFDMGNIYLNGITKKANIEKSLYWYRKACDRNQPDSCNQIGIMHQNGIGVEQNYSLAISFFNKAADLGLMMAHNNIGAMYLNGTGVEKDYKEAFRRFSIASNENTPLATRNLGVMYQYGFGVDIDHEKAKVLFEKAANSGDVEAMFNLAYLYDDVDKINAFYWFQQAAENGHELAQIEVGARYDDGIGVKQDYGKARYWYEASLDHADELSLYKLAEIYNYGKGVNANLDKAEKYYRMSADKGFDLAQFELGRLYSSIGMNEKAIKWYKLSGEAGYWPAQRLLGDAYSIKKSDFGEIEDFKKAEYWYLKAIEEGDVESIASLGWIYVLEHDELGRKRKLFNPEKGVKLLNEALEQGSKRVNSYLAYVYEFGVGVDKNIEKSISFDIDHAKNIKLSGKKPIDFLVGIFETQVDNRLYKDDLVNAVFPFLIKSSESGNMDHQIILGKAYLSPKFPYYDIDEGLFWLNKAAKKSIKANEQLVFNHFGFDGMKFDLDLVLHYIDRAIELYESGEAADITYYRAHGLFQMIDLYHRGAELNLSFGKKNISESLLRRASSIHMPNNVIRYTNERKLILSSILQGRGDLVAAEEVLRDVISHNIIEGSDYFTLSNYIKATNQLSVILYQDGRKSEAIDLLVTLLPLINKSAADDSIKSYWVMLINLEISQYFALINDTKSARRYLNEYQNIKDANIKVDLFDMIEKMSLAIIEAHHGNYSDSYDAIYNLMLMAETRDIPVTSDNKFLVHKLSLIMADNHEYTYAYKIIDQFIGLYKMHVNNIVSNDGVISSHDKDKLKNIVSNYIHYSEKISQDSVQDSFESMQLASGLTVSDSLIKSLMRAHIGSEESILRKKVDNLLVGRRLLLNEKYEHIDDVSKILTVNKKLDVLDKKIADRQDQINKITASKSLFDKYIVSVPEVQDKLAVKDALITMLISDDRSYVWFITKNGSSRYTSSLTSGESAQLVKVLKKALNPSSEISSEMSFPFHASNALFNEIIGPFKDQLSDIDRLLVVPDPIISSIPLTILTKDIDNYKVDNDDEFSVKRNVRGIGTIHANKSIRSGGWLINDYAISVIPSVYSFVAHNNLVQHKEPSNFLGIGDPSLHGDSTVITVAEIASSLDTRGLASSYSLDSLSPLPETKQELELIASNFENSLVLSGSNATEKNLRETSLLQYDVLSFATHALVANEIGGIVEPSLVLTPGDYDTSDNDGLLQMSEISKLHIDADIVLLSACNTASPYTSSSSEGLSGLANSFFQAGARSLLVSYWSVISDSAIDLTTRMFKPANDGRSYAHKHQNAVLDLLRTSKDRFKSHPSYWAPFSVVGIY